MAFHFEINQDQSGREISRLMDWLISRRLGVGRRKTVRNGLEREGEKSEKWTKDGDRSEETSEREKTKDSEKERKL